MLLDTVTILAAPIYILLGWYWRFQLSTSLLKRFMDRFSFYNTWAGIVGMVFRNDGRQFGYADSDGKSKNARYIENYFAISSVKGQFLNTTSFVFGFGSFTRFEKSCCWIFFHFSGILGDQINTCILTLINLVCFGGVIVPALFSKWLFSFSPQCTM